MELTLTQLEIIMLANALDSQKARAARADREAIRAADDAQAEHMIVIRMQRQLDALRQNHLNSTTV